MASTRPEYCLHDGQLTCFVDSWTYPFAQHMMQRMFELVEFGVLEPQSVTIASDFFAIDGGGTAVLDWARQRDAVKVYVLACLLDRGWIRRLTLLGCNAECTVMQQTSRLLDRLSCVLDYTDYMRGTLHDVSAAGETRP